MKKHKSFLVIACKTCGESLLKLCIFHDSFSAYCPRCKKAVVIISTEEMEAFCKASFHHGCDECGEKPEKEKKTN